MSTQAGVDRSKLKSATENLAGQVAAMIKDLPDTNIPIPNMDWTVGDAAAHLSDAQRFMARLAAGEELHHGDGTPASLEHANRVLLASNPVREGPMLAESIVENTQQFLRNSASLPAGQTLLTPMGSMDSDTFLGYVLTHVMMHGFQIGEALHKRLKVDSSTAEMALPFIMHALPSVVDQKAAAGLKACYQVMSRGGSRYWVLMNNGTATIHRTKPARVDCFLSANPVAFLKVGFRLKSQWPMIAQGKLLAWGPKPWLGFRFAGLFMPP